MGTPKTKKLKTNKPELTDSPKVIKSNIKINELIEQMQQQQQVQTAASEQIVQNKPEQTVLSADFELRLENANKTSPSKLNKIGSIESNLSTQTATNRKSGKKEESPAKATTKRRRSSQKSSNEDGVNVADQIRQVFVLFNTKIKEFLEMGTCFRLIMPKFISKNSKKL